MCNKVSCCMCAVESEGRVSASTSHHCTIIPDAPSLRGGALCVMGRQQVIAGV